MSYEEIKKALEGVTPGPWELCAHLKYNDACSCGYRGVIYGPEPDGFAICQPGHEPAPEGQEGTEPPRYPRDVEIANMRYIAAVNPSAISELLSTLESLQRENEELRQDRDRTARNRDMYKGQVERQAAQIEDFRSETKRLQVGVYVETLPAVHLIRVFADDMNERNWDDKRAYIKQQADRIRTALASTGGEHDAE